MNRLILNKPGIGDIISRAWRLYRLNAFQVTLYAVIPTLIIAVAKVLLNLPGVLNTGNSWDMVGSVVLFLIPGITLFFIGIFVSIFFNYCLFKAFYNILTLKNYKYKQILAIAKDKMIQILKLSLWVSFQAIIFIILDLVIFFSTMAIIIIFSAQFLPLKFLFNNEYLKYPSYAVLIILLLVILFTYILIISLQTLFCGLQIVNFVVKNGTFKALLVESYNMIKNNLFRSCLFAISVYLLSYILIGFFNMPAFILISFLSGKIVVFDQTILSIFLLSILEAWNAVVNIFIWPFVASCIMTFYFHCRVNSEGLDLNLALKELKE